VSVQSGISAATTFAEELSTAAYIFDYASYCLFKALLSYKGSRGDLALDARHFLLTGFHRGNSFRYPLYRMSLGLPLAFLVRFL